MTASNRRWRSGVSSCGRVDREREVELGELEQVVEQFAQLIVIEVSEPAGGVACLLGEVGAREVVLAGPAVFSAAAFDLAA